MKIIRVTYTVKKEFVEANKRNIERVMSDLKAEKNHSIKYSSFLEPDGKTFMHFVMHPDTETLSVLEGLDSFKNFRKELKGSMPEIAPQQTDLSLVASAYNLI